MVKLIVLIASLMTFCAVFALIRLSVGAPCSLLLSLLNNAVHASTGYTPFYVNGLTHPRVPLALPLCGSGLGGGEVADRLADISPDTVQKKVGKFLATRLNF